MKALGLTLSKINDWIRERLPVSLTTPTHPYKPEDTIWVKKWNVQPLKPPWQEHPSQWIRDTELAIGGEML
jgi:hypothetical protein